MRAALSLLELDDEPPPPELEELLLESSSPPWLLLLLELLPPLLLLLLLPPPLLELLDEPPSDDDEELDEAGGAELDDAEGEDVGRSGPDTDSPVVHPPSIPKPARALAPESTFRNSRRSSRSRLSSRRTRFFGIDTSAAQGVQAQYQARRARRRLPPGPTLMSFDARGYDGGGDAGASRRDRNPCVGRLVARELFAMCGVVAIFLLVYLGMILGGLPFQMRGRLQPGVGTSAA